MLNFGNQASYMLSSVKYLISELQCSLENKENLSALRSSRLTYIWLCATIQWGTFITPLFLLTNAHKRNPIAHPSGWAMGCLLWVQTLIYILPQSLQWCMQYHAILSSVITGQHYNGTWLYHIFHYNGLSKKDLTAVHLQTVLDLICTNQLICDMLFLRKYTTLTV